MMLSATWKDYFTSLAANEMGNQNTAVYTTAWAMVVPPATKISTLTSDPDMILFAADTENTLITLHSFTNLGGSLLRPNNKVVCLTGSGHAGVPLIVDDKSATAECTFKTPSVDLIIAGKTPTELEGIADPTTTVQGDHEDYLGCNTFLPAPWLSNAILSSNSNDPFELILVAITAAKAFDAEHDDDSTYLTSADSHLRDFVAWAWGVKRGKVPPTSYRLGLTDAQLQTFQSDRHNKCIAHSASSPNNMVGSPVGMPLLPPGPPPIFAPPGTPTATDAVLQQLTASISRQADEQKAQNMILTHQVEYTMEKEEKKKDRFKKLHSSTKQLILFASAEDATNVPTEVGENCKRFINAETMGVAEHELNLQFKNIGLQDAAFSPGLTQALYSGKFLWADKSTPSNFSPFSFFEVEPLQAADQQNRHLILHLVETQGKGKTLEEIKAGNKQEVKAPTKFLEMIHQLSFFAGACSIFFGSKSIPYQAMMALAELVDKNRLVLKARETDKTFMSQFLFAVDTRFQIWLDECMTAAHRTDVNDGTLNFSPLIDSIKLSTFFVNLPSTFVTPKDKETTTSPSSGGDNPTSNKRAAEDKAHEDESPSKKKKKGKNYKNNSQPEAFRTQPGETWATHYANKCFNERVDWNGTCKMCPRWFIRGDCFKNCPNIASHVAEADIPSAKLTAFQQFIRNCRSAPSSPNNNTSD
jgi:hypothetical protein